MAGRGPPRTPTALLLARGSLIGRYRQPEPQPVDGLPERPPDLVGVEAECWDRLAPLLYAQGTLALADADTLERYCVLYSRWSAAAAAVRAEGAFVTITTREGDRRQVQHPAVRLELDCAKELRQLAAQLGLTAASRASLSASPDAGGGEDDPFRCPT